MQAIELLRTRYSASKLGGDDLIIGFIYVGTDSGGAPSRLRPAVHEIAHRWAGDGHTSTTP